MDAETRIQQFRQMSEADPNNELGHFSLGKALLEAGRHGEAVPPLKRALDLNPSLSRAYQFLGDALDGSGERDKAIETLTQGISVADEQGDRQPRDKMMERLSGWGAPVPAIRQVEKPTAVDAESGESVEGFRCARCGRPSGKLPKTPFRGALGEKVFANTCDACWREWIGMGTKVINELGLTLSSKTGQDTYDQYMIEFLQLEDR